MQSEVESHMMVKSGIAPKMSSFQRTSWYLAGSWKPTMTSWIPMTTLLTP